MVVNKLYIKDFGCYGEASVDFTSHQVWLIKGKNRDRGGSSNGSGKSTLRDAISWALWGVARGLTKPGSDIIRQGKSSCVVYLEFEANGKTCWVLRSAGRGSSLRFSAYQGQTLADTQQAINSFLGIDYDAFSKSACFEQGGSDAFSRLKPAEAKKYVINLLNLGVYGQLEQTARKALDSYQSQLQVYSRELELLKIKAEEFRDVQKNFDRARAQKNSKQKALDDAQSKIREAELHLQDIEAQKEEASKSFYALRDQLTSLVTRGRLAVQDKARVESLDSTCPQCQQSVPDKHKAALLKEAEAKITSLRERSAEIKASTDAQQALMESFSTEAARRKLNTLRSEESQCQTDLRHALVSLKEWESKLSNAEDLSDRVQEKQDLTRELQDKIIVYRNLVDAFGKNGIPSYIIEGVIPEIRSIANQLVQTLTDGRMRVTIQVQKTLKSGETGDTLEIIVGDEIGDRPYNLYSGGERFIIDFSLRIALSVLLSRRCGSPIQTLIIDEGLGALDEDNRTKFVEALNLAAARFGFKRILLITHATDVHDFFENVIEVVKDKGGSRVSGQEVIVPGMLMETPQPATGEKGGNKLAAVPTVAPTEDLW